MIDPDKYEGHTEGPWVATQIKRSEYPDEYIIESGDGMLMTGFVGLGNDGVNAKLMADAPLLLAEVKRLRKLEAAVVGSWMEACEHRGPWHKALRYPCVELGYLVLEGHTFELAEEYQEMAKEWIRQKMVEIYGEDWDEER